MLNGWIRWFQSDGSYTATADPHGPGTLGPPPSAKGWQNYDAVANQLGVGGNVAATRAKAMTGSNNFFDKVGGAINTALVQFDQTITRPTVHTVAEATAVLDRVVPGWSVLVDLLYPILPFVPALTSALAAISGITPALTGAAIDSVVKLAENVSTLTGGNIPLDQVISPIASFSQQAISDAVTYAAKVGTTNAQAVQNVQSVLAKAIATASTTRGTVLDKFAATSIEAAQSLILALKIAGTVATAGTTTLALQALALSLQATLAGVTATGDAAAKAEAAGWVVAKGAPALLAGVAAALPSDVASVPVIIGADSFTTAEGVVVSANPLASTTLGALVSGIASLESTAISTAATVGQVALAAQQIKRAADASRKATLARVASLDAQTVQLQNQLAALKAKPAGVIQSTGGGSSLVPLAVVGIAAAVISEVLS